MKRRVKSKDKAQKRRERKQGQLETIGEDRWRKKGISGKVRKCVGGWEGQEESMEEGEEAGTRE